MRSMRSLCRGLTLATWVPMLGLVGLMGLTGLTGAAQAQPAGSEPAKAAPVISGPQLNESRLVDALAIPDPAAPAGETRGFRPARAGEAPKRYEQGKASLLVTFNTASVEPTPESMAVLDTLARAMQSDTLAGVSFRIEGHADARGNPGDNLTLSQARADAVARYLATRHGIVADRLKPVGKGASEPMNTARVDAPENRRVTIVSFR